MLNIGDRQETSKTALSNVINFNVSKEVNVFHEFYYIYNSIQFLKTFDEIFDVRRGLVVSAWDFDIWPDQMNVSGLVVLLHGIPDKSILVGRRYCQRDSLIYIKYSLCTLLRVCFTH